METTTKHTATPLTTLKLANGRLLSFENPLVMGVLNITPDSFYDGGKYDNLESAAGQAKKLLDEGVDIIDIGAASTKPNAALISPEDELRRLIPVLDAIIKDVPNCIISIDTFQSEVARECIKHGASIINDISGGTLDDNMLSTVADLQVPYILMHIQGTPQTMQLEPTYKNVVDEVFDFLSTQTHKAKEAGIKQLIIDPGFGFGKTVEHNYSLLHNLSKFKSLGLPLMAGLSRKSMINKVLQTKPEDALNGTTVLNTLALLQGANILRVHDVKEAKQVLKLVRQYLKPNTEV